MLLFGKKSGNKLALLCGIVAVWNQFQSIEIVPSGKLLGVSFLISVVLLKFAEC